MKFEQSHKVVTDERVYTLTLTGSEMTAVELHEFDKLLLRECETSGKISDKLLALETIVRRIEEASR